MRIKVKDWFDVDSGRLQSGDIGIEVEIEGLKLPRSFNTDEGNGTWSITTDSSLRNGLEYVLRRPVAAEHLESVLKILSDGFKSSNAKLHPSVRTGVHVHVNVQSMTLTEVINMLCIYYIFEEFLVEYCGESRVGNLFCLRIKDAKFMLKHLLKVISTKRFQDLNTDDIRYASVNLKALRTYGSLEFRSMRTPKDVMDIVPWCNMLMCIRNKAVEFKNPLEVVSTAKEGIEVFARTIFGDLFDELFKGNFDITKAKHGLFVSMDIAHCTNWDGYDKLPNNPFKRAIGGL